MSKNSKSHKRETHYKKAKQNGYRARSAFKLIEIQKRYNIFKRAFYILDLGSAPGSWLQVAKKFAEENLGKYIDKYYHRNHYKIMGVDTKNVSPLEGLNIIKMDFTNEEFKDEIHNYFKGELLDLIISDASINKSGNKFSDQANQIKLCYEILELTHLLKAKGSLVIKLFQGADFERFYQDMKKKFMIIRSFKPKSSYKKSNEIFLILLKKR